MSSGADSVGEIVSGDYFVIAQRIVDIVANSVQVVAILVGGAWAYLKFIRGRTFFYRAELQVKSDLRVFDDSPSLLVKITLKNDGLSRIPLSTDQVAVFVDCLPSSLWFEGPANWRPVLIAGANGSEDPLPLLTPILTEHHAIESGETIVDEELITVPVDEEMGIPLAFRVRAQMVATKTFPRRRSILWSASSIVPTSALVAADSSTGGRNAAEGL